MEGDDVLKHNIYRMLTVIRATRCTNRGPWSMGIMARGRSSRYRYRYRYRKSDDRGVVGKLNIVEYHTGENMSGDIHV